jgi:hypothetical protein
MSIHNLHTTKLQFKFNKSENSIWHTGYEETKFNESIVSSRLNETNYKQELITEATNLLRKLNEEVSSKSGKWKVWNNNLFNEFTVSATFVDNPDGGHYFVDVFRIDYPELNMLRGNSKNSNDLLENLNRLK